MENYEQLSLFTAIQPEAVAINCSDRSQLPLVPLEDWIKKLVPSAEYAIRVADHCMALSEAKKIMKNIEPGHLYHYYSVNGRLFDGVFVGRAAD